MQQSKTLIIGIGNAYRCDDSVGLHLARKIDAMAMTNVEVAETSGEGATLIEMIKERSEVLIFDAVSSQAEAGTAFRFEAHHEEIPTKFFNYSTHAFSLAEAIEMARALNQLPERLIVYGIEGKDFGSGRQMSPEVEQAMPQVLAKARKDIETLNQSLQRKEIP